MSLITLRSSAKDNGANVFESASYWTNHFKKGIKLHPGNTLELVSMSINKIDKFEIIQGQNDTFLWRIGTGSNSQGGAPVFQQHQITIPSGSYNGLELASTVENLCNSSTFLDPYQGQWVCSYTQDSIESVGSFVLNYGQRATPSDNFNESKIVEIINPTTDGLVPTFTPSSTGSTAGSQLVQFSPSLGNMDGIDTPTHLIQGARGVFGNNGQFSAIINPFRILGDVDIVGTRDFTNFLGDTKTKIGVVERYTSEISDYTHSVTMQSGLDGAISSTLMGISGSLFTDGSSIGSILTAGTGYAVGNSGFLTGGTGEGCVYNVSAVSPTGGVSDLTLSGDSFGYTVGDVLTLSNNGDGGSTFTVSAVNTNAFGTSYSAGDIGDLISVFPLSSSPSVIGKYRVLGVTPTGAVGTIAVLDGFKGVGYNSGDVVRLDGNGDQEAYAQISGVEGGRKDFVGKLDTQGVFGMKSSEGKIWYNLSSANPFLNAYYTPNSTDTFDTVGSVDGGYTFRRVKSQGTSPVYWVKDDSKTNRFKEYSSLPISGTPADTFDLIQQGVFLSSQYGTTVRSQSWVSGTIPPVMTDLPAADQTTATYRYLYDSTTDDFSTTNFSGSVRRIVVPSGGNFVPTYVKNYGSTSIGFVRNDLVTGRTKYPNDSNATFSLQKSDCDMVFEVVSDPDSLGILTSLTQMNNTGSVSYPTPGWRNFKTVFSTKPDSWNSDLSVSKPDNWTSFTYGIDSIKISYTVTNFRTMILTIGHDNAGDGIFTEEVILLKTGQEGMNSKRLTLNVREVFYPLRPIVMMSRGSSFDGRSLRLSGRMDSQELTQDNSVLKNNDSGTTPLDTFSDAEYNFEDSFGAGADMTLSSMFKFNTISQSQVIPGTEPMTVNQIRPQDLQPNIANVSNIFGFENLYNFPSGNASNSIATSSGRVPITQILEPSLHIELPDFNIESWSGESGDSTKSIAIIPREQWTTDAKKGTLHWQSQYPLPVELNLTETKMLYTLTARIREPSGELVKDLINPTELTLRIGETAESRQQRIMDKAFERIAGVVSNRQDALISNVGQMGRTV